MSFRYNVPSQEFELENAHLAMPGEHQAANAAVALATICELRHQGWCISKDAVRLGLSQAKLPGRVEIVRGDRTIVLDTAHNAASAQALVATLAERPRVSRRTLILSISYDKDVQAIVRELIPHFERVIVTQYQENPRAVAAEQLLEIVRRAHATDQNESCLCRTPAEAWKLATTSAEPGECICIAGSFYLAAEMRPLIYAADISEPLAR